jgi:ADP-ribosylglycohydrolase
MKLIKTRRSTATLFGVAFGDAMGRNTEFVYSVKQIIRRNLVTYDLPRPALVTDDTDMTRYVARALLHSPDVRPETLATAFVDEFVEWHENMDYGRKPGASCISAVRGLIADPKRDWLGNTDPFAKGCGANMRVAPVALDPRLVPNFEDVAGAAQLQAAITHGHPTALAAAELTAYAIWLVRWENQPLDETIIEPLLDRCVDQRGNYRGDWLGDLDKHWATRGRGYGRKWKPVNARRALTNGWDEMFNAILDADDALPHADDTDDVCTFTGGGWVAEEALAGALVAAIWHRMNPVRALMRAATTSGDSDSIASITGALHGAAYGYDAWPRDWYDRIEFADELAEYGERWD